MKGFKITGFVPFSENIFPGGEFLAPIVTNRPMLQETDLDETATNKAKTISVFNVSIQIYRHLSIHFKL